MDNSNRKGLIEVIVTYILWGLLPLFWNLLSGADSMYVMAQRVIWSMLAMVLYLTAIHRLSEVRQIFSNKRMCIRLFLSGALICLNWGVYIYAVNSGHVLDASLGYFLEPIIVTLIGLILFREKMSRLEQLTAVFSVIGVGYLIFSYRTLPVLAIVLGGSFAVYGAVKKQMLSLKPEISLFGETFMMAPIALVFCIFSELHGHGSLNVFHGWQFLLFPLSGVVTSIPLLLFNRGVRHIPYYLTGILMYINPTIQFLMGLFYFHEALEVPRLIAFGFIWVGIGFTIWHNVQLGRRGSHA